MFGYWEKVDKKHCLELLGKTQQLIKYYEACHSAVLNKVVPAQLHSAISGLGKAISKSQGFYAWYTDVKAVYDAIEELNRLKYTSSTEEKAKAFGHMFTALAAFAARVPAAQIYAQALEAFGKNFEPMVDRLKGKHGMNNNDYERLMNNPSGAWGG